MKLRSVAAATTAALMLSFGGHAMADSTDDIIQKLVSKGVLTEDEGAQLFKGRASEKADTAKAAAKMPKIKTEGKIAISGDNWEFRPIGRIMWDAIDTDEDGSGQPDFNGTELRRARLGFQGKIYDWGYKFEADFGTAGKDSVKNSSAEVAIKDAYISYGKKIGDVKVGVKLGQSHIAYGLNTKISSKYMTFIDRPYFADSIISEARESGAVFHVADKKYKWALTAGLTDGQFNGGKAAANGTTFSVRGSVLPYMKDKKHWIQLGAGFLTKGGGDGFHYKQRLVSHSDKKKWLDGKVSDFDGADAYTLDAMGAYGPFHAMAEYNDYNADSKSGNDVEFKGYAVEAGYFLTGESMKFKKGYTSGIKPKSSAGAWEVAGRFENLKIEDKLAGNDEADKFTIGLNYYPRQNLRIMLNYDKVTDLKVNGADAKFEPSSLKLRAQAYW